MVPGPDILNVVLLFLLHNLHSESAKFEVIGPTDPIVVEAGDDIILPCYLKPNISVEDMTVDWRNLDSTNHLFYQSWYGDTKINLFVQAVGSRPVVSIERHRDGGMGLLCESEGWHPEPELVWLDSKGVSLSDGRPETHRDLNGFYRVRQQVIVQETDTNRFTCRVLQRHINEQVETEVHVPSELFYYTSPWRRFFIVLCFLGIITVIGVSLAVNCKFRKKDERIAHLKQQLGYFSTYLFESIRRHTVDVTLDPDTAHPWLNLSDDGKQVYHTNIKQDLPDNPDKFNFWPSVLGKEGFSSGRFYYEVQVKEKTTRTLGVVRESVNRKGWTTLGPYNGYWTVRLWNGVYEAITDHSVTLPLREKPQKVGVFVDYEEGQVSFLNVEARCLIYSFTGYTFTEKLFPFFSPEPNHGGKNSAPLVICPVNITD
ncbi:hypothetical protein UPYG_G00132520 [Umbra pygmaea]|uniref:Butyrophilin subfamily 1 member A1-like n=1 Tax=Umbra pygmaea TaxID=75934 RepID=A0ABD0WXW9_UMBPY